MFFFSIKLFVARMALMGKPVKTDINRAIIDTFKDKKLFRIDLYQKN